VRGLERNDKRGLETFKNGRRRRRRRRVISLARRGPRFISFPHISPTFPTLLSRFRLRLLCAQWWVSRQCTVMNRDQMNHVHKEIPLLPRSLNILWISTHISEHLAAAAATTCSTIETFCASVVLRQKKMMTRKIRRQVKIGSSQLRDKLYGTKNEKNREQIYFLKNHFLFSGNWTGVNIMFLAQFLVGKFDKQNGRIRGFFFKLFTLFIKFL